MSNTKASLTDYSEKRNWTLRMGACQARRMGSNRAYRAPAALLLTVVLWASALPATRGGVTGDGWAGRALLRLAIASAALAIVCALAGIRRPAPRDLPLIGVCAATGMAGYQLLLNWGELRVSGGTASLIVVTNPVYSAVIATAFLGERIARRQVLGGAIALAGVAAITFGQGGPHLERPALAVLAAAVALGAYHGAIKPLLGRYTGRGHRVRDMGGDGPAAPDDPRARARVATGRFAGHCCSGVPRPGAVRARVRGLGLRGGAAPCHGRDRVALPGAADRRPGGLRMAGRQAHGDRADRRRHRHRRGPGRQPSGRKGRCAGRALSRARGRR